jgi:hypothetical protein
MKPPPVIKTFDAPPGVADLNFVYNFCGKQKTLIECSNKFTLGIVVGSPFKQFEKDSRRMTI